QLHFELAEVLKPFDPVRAKEHVLQALEKAPRFRQAHHLLLELIDGPSESAQVPDEPAQAPATSHGATVQTPASPPSVGESGDAEAERHKSAEAVGDKSDEAESADAGPSSPGEDAEGSEGGCNAADKA